jgi:hypothetical protein
MAMPTPSWPPSDQWTNSSGPMGHRLAGVRPTCRTFRRRSGGWWTSLLRSRTRAASGVVSGSYNPTVRKTIAGAGFAGHEIVELFASRHV